MSNRFSSFIKKILLGKNKNLVSLDEPYYVMARLLKGVHVAGIIDAGASKVVTVMADLYGDGDLRILGVGVAASQGTERDIITSPRQAATAISQSVRKAEKMAG